MNAMRPPIIIQARMGSTRLPGKTLMELLPGRTALDLMVERVRRCQTAGPVVVATTEAPEDRPIVAQCESLGIECFCGDVDDVLDRFYYCALDLGPPDALVRLTGDCPLHDPVVIDQVVADFRDSQADYASNVAPPTFPDGLDVEAMRFRVLEDAWTAARLPSDREHVTPYIRNHPDRFSVVNTTHATDLSQLRWTLDEEKDLAFVRAVYGALYETNPAFSMEDVLALLRKQPELTTINAGIGRNEGYMRSLHEDTRHGG